MSIYPRKVILDVDAGIDDAWALLLMLKAEQKNLIEIIAITCCHGNAELSEVVDNVCRVLQAFGRKNVSTSTQPVKVEETHYHHVSSWGVRKDVVQSFPIIL
jgi:Inosine-uridine nucleoside N-ribohydrolase